MSNCAIAKFSLLMDRFRGGFRHANVASLKPTLFVVLIPCLLLACSQQYAVSVNNRAVFDPNNRLPSGEAINPDLQGCINLAMRQQSTTDPSQLTVLSCANSQVDALDNIGQLVSLRFLDLADNKITNITPLENLQILGGLNLTNNDILDIAVLFNLNSLVSVSLLGNDEIPCSQVAALKEKLGENFTPPLACRD